MKNDKAQTVETLHSEQCSCVILKDGATHIYRERGVKDLYRLLCDNPELLRGSFIADKVVGKAAASLMILGNVAELYADTISEPALDIINRSGMTVEYGLKVDHIINRAHTGWCPLETRCFDKSTPDECFREIEDFIKTVNTK